MFGYTKDVWFHLDVHVFYILFYLNSLAGTFFLVAGAVSSRLHMDEPRWEKQGCIRPNQGGWL